MEFCPPTKRLEMLRTIGYGDEKAWQAIDATNLTQELKNAHPLGAHFPISIGHEWELQGNSARQEVLDCVTQR